MEIGVYGGSFDPIHLGHINLALAICEARKLDQICFCPAYVNPFKSGSDIPNLNHRLEMLKLALLDIPQCQILTAEIERQGISYTVDTLRTLIHAEQGKPFPNRYSLILGADAAAHFAKWKEPEEIARLVPIYVGTRSTNQLLLENSLLPSIRTALSAGITEVPLFDISSTQIRSRIAAGLYCGHLVPSKVLSYIRDKHLYEAV